MGAYSTLNKAIALRKECAMENLLPQISIKEDFEAQATAALMIPNNALVPIKLAAKLCGISIQEINRRIARGTFPKPQKLPSRRKTFREAFYLRDLHEWIKNPNTYLQKGRSL